MFCCVLKLLKNLNEVVYCLRVRLRESSLYIHTQKRKFTFHFTIFHVHGVKKEKEGKRATTVDAFYQSHGTSLFERITSGM